MSRTNRRRQILVSVATLAATVLLSTSALAAGEKTSPFAGPKANTGYATLSKQDGKGVLTLSDDFKVPETPDPHWQVVDSKGNVFLLQRLPIKGDKVNRSITLPAYVSDVAKVQIWCGFAEVLLGEASFATPVH